MSEKMRALVYQGIGKLGMEEAPMPEGEFILRVEGCGICGTDLKTYQQGHHYFTPPTIIGHEFYGRVIKAPPDGQYREGDLAVVAPYFECGQCETCENALPQLCGHKMYVPGAFCEFVAIPRGYEAGLFKIPVDRIPAELLGAFTLVEPLACVLNGVAHLNLSPGSRVLVVGGGPMGILFALYFQRRGIDVTVVEPNEERRNKINQWHIPCRRPEEVAPKTYDQIVVAVNRGELVSEYVRNVRDGGRVLVFAGLKKGTDVAIDSYAVHYREVSLAGCSGFALSHFREAFSLIVEAPEHFHKLITHHFPLDEGEKAFALLAQGKAFKIILAP
jgi:L-iditol 2-dehydrogenase